MKNFSELLVTDPEIKVELVLGSIIDNGVPHVDLWAQGRRLWKGDLYKDLEFETRMPLMQLVDIQIGMTGKVYSTQRETAVIIRKLALDGFNLVPNHAQATWYDTDQGVQLANFYLGFNGVWRLQLPEPFYRWRHRATDQGWLLLPQ